MKEKSFDREEELLEAALEEFSTNSYEKASLNNIIKRAGISKGTFYYHFQDKQALYLYVLEHAVNAKWEFIRDTVQEGGVVADGTDIFELFKLQARAGAQFARAHPQYHMLGKMFAKEKGNDIYAVAKAALGKDGEVPLASMIDSAIDSGVFKERFSRNFIVRVISHMFATFDEVFGDEVDLDMVIKNLDDYVDFMRYGLERGKKDEA
jgi:TetR/AcrR family transcriptional regulator